LVELGVGDLPVCESLARKGLLVRPGSEFGLSGFARVTIAPEVIMGLVAREIVGAVS
jgi:hypothetical protein